MENDIIARIENLEKDVLVIKSKFEDTFNSNIHRGIKMQDVQNLCYSKIKEYESLLQMFEKDDEIVKRAKIERDLAQQIYTMLF